MSKRAPQFEDCLRLERFTGGDYCEKKNLLCYASNKSNGIILKNLDTKETKKISAGGKGEGNPAFSPDGSQILFLSAVQGGRQIWLYDLETEEIRQLTDIRGSVSEPLWSPDGNWILFASMVSQKTASQRKYEDEAFVIEEVNYKFDGRGYIPPDGRQQLYIVSVKDGTVIQLTDDQTDYMHANWAPDSERVVCVSDRFQETKTTMVYDLVMIEHVTEQPSMRQLTKDHVIVSYPNPVRPVFSPDGKSVIAGILDMNTERGFSIGYPEVYLWQFDNMTGDGVRIFQPDENCYQCVQFPYNAGSGWGLEKLQVSDDGTYVYFVSGWQGQCCLYRLRLYKSSGNTGNDREYIRQLEEYYPVHAEKVLDGKAVHHGIGKIQNGKMLIPRSEPDMPEAYFILDTTLEFTSTEDTKTEVTGICSADTFVTSKGARMTKAAQSAQDLIEEVEFVRPDDFFIPTLDGESQIHGWVYKPADIAEEKIPAFLYVHGGPHPFYTYGFTMEHQCFAAAGFGVMLCNPRGSSGYGALHQTFARSTDGSAYYDCLQFVEECIRRNDWIDGSRIGVTGGSYGGYMTNYMATHSKRFNAYITQRCVSSDLIMYASSDMSGSSKDYEKFEDFMLAQLKSSPVSYAENIDRPFLILQGEEDYRTPMENAHQLFVAIKDVHPELPVKLVVYPHTPHDQPTHPGMMMDYYHEMVEWFRAYL